MRLIVSIIGLFTYSVFLGFPVIYVVDKLV